MPLLKVSAGKATGGSVKVKRWRHGNVTPENICQTLLQLGQMDPNTPPTPAAKPPSMAADAFTNPDYMRYAVKNAARLFDLLHLLQRRGLGKAFTPVC